MIRKTIITVLISTLFVQYAFAQADVTTPSGSHEKMFDHYVGVQMNQLIRQVFNFNNSTATTISNPYLFIYSINMRNTGWGLRVGIGYNYNSTTNDDGITRTDNSMNDLQFRFGVEKLFVLTNKWSAGAGIDGLMNINDDKTTTKLNSALDTSNSVVHTTLGTYGVGAMGWLRYSITKNILIGTEASFYYTSGKQKQDATTTTSNNGQINTSISKTNNSVSSGLISLPVVFYLMVRF